MTVTKWGLGAIALLVLVVGGYYIAASAGLDFSAHAESANGQEFWVKRCDQPVAQGEGQEQETPPQGEEYCEIVQRLTVTDTNQRLVEMAVGYPADSKNARGVLILPLGILLESGILIQVDDNDPLRASVRRCDQGGCYVFLDMTDSVLDEFKAGEEINVLFQTPQPQAMSVALSLKGFTKALKSIQ